MRRSPLFSAVVLAGFSLTHAVAACSGEAETSEQPTSDDAATERDDAAAEREDAPSGSDFVPEEPDSRDASAESCPDGSDSPTPPCILIK